MPHSTDYYNKTRFIGLNRGRDYIYQDGPWSDPGPVFECPVWPLWPIPPAEGQSYTAFCVAGREGSVTRGPFPLAAFSHGAELLGDVDPPPDFIQISIDGEVRQDTGYYTACRDPAFARQVCVGELAAEPNLFTLNVESSVGWSIGAENRGGNPATGWYGSNVDGSTGDRATNVVHGYLVRDQTNGPAYAGNHHNLAVPELFALDEVTAIGGTIDYNTHDIVMGHPYITYRIRTYYQIVYEIPPEGSIGIGPVKRGVFWGDKGGARPKVRGRP